MKELDSSSNSLLQSKLQSSDTQKPAKKQLTPKASPPQNVAKQMRAKMATENDTIPSYAATDKEPLSKEASSTKDISLGQIPQSAKKHKRKRPKRGILPESKIHPTVAEKASDQAPSIPPKYMPPEEPFESAEDFDAALDFESAQEVKRQQQASFIKTKASKFIIGTLVLLCLYLAFLTYGLLQTSYVYNDMGNITAEILSVDDLKELNQYEELSGYYLRTRILYEDVLECDYHLALNGDNSRAIAREYLGLLDTVSKLSTDLKANELDIAYAGITNQIYELVYTHIAVYLQNMNNAITTNNSNAANQALQGREVINQQFAALTANMADLCRTTRGAKNGDIYDWSPENFISGLGGAE